MLSIRPILKLLKRRRPAPKRSFVAIPIQSLAHNDSLRSATDPEVKSEDPLFALLERSQLFTFLLDLIQRPPLIAS